MIKRHGRFVHRMAGVLKRDARNGPRIFNIFTVAVALALALTWNLWQAGRLFRVWTGAAFWLEYAVTCADICSDLCTCVHRKCPFLARPRRNGRPPRRTNEATTPWIHLPTYRPGSFIHFISFHAASYIHPSTHSSIRPFVHSSIPLVPSSNLLVFPFIHSRFHEQSSSDLLVALQLTTVD